MHYNATACNALQTLQHTMLCKFSSYSHIIYRTITSYKGTSCSLPLPFLIPFQFIHGMSPRMNKFHVVVISISLIFLQITRKHSAKPLNHAANALAHSTSQARQHCKRYSRQRSAKAPAIPISTLQLLLMKGHQVHCLYHSSFHSNSFTECPQNITSNSMLLSSALALSSPYPIRYTTRKAL